MTDPGEIALKRVATPAEIATLMTLHLGGKVTVEPDHGTFADHNLLTWECPRGSVHRMGSLPNQTALGVWLEIARDPSWDKWHSEQHSSATRREEGRR